MKGEKQYIVSACKWGDFHNFSYVVSVFADKEKAIEVANSHSNYRGGKYECVVEEVTTGLIIDNEGDAKEIYRTDLHKTYEK